MTLIIPGFVCLSLFQEYGDIEYCVIIKNKTTGESKGLGYVRYYKPSQAAIAIENCDKSKMVPNWVLYLKLTEYLVCIFSFCLSELWH